VERIPIALSVFDNDPFRHSAFYRRQTSVGKAILFHRT
jgi:hypothetical protein